MDGDSDCGSVDCDCCCMCDLCVETECCGVCSPSTNCCVCVSCSRSSSTTCCCCWFVTALTAVAIVATLIAVLVVAYAVAFPARVTVEDAYLSRFALTNGTTALAYDVSLTIAVRNRDFATGVWRTAPLDAELRFRGQTFARASAHLESAEWGLFEARGKGVYRVTASSSSSSTAADRAVALGGDNGVMAEFVMESVAGVFQLELAVVGGEVKDEERHGGRDGSVRVTCPLKLSLPTATAAVAFTTVKCTS